MDTGQIHVAAPDALTAQARRHYEIRDYCNQIAGEFESKYQAVLSELQGGQAQQYQQWWTTLKAHLLKMASQHDQFGRNLEAACAGYETLEPHVARSFVRNQPS